MRLKNIKLAGFKSFVDPTNVQLTKPMVAIVGPNGCGKSNVIDAVRWVMGESSAKNLRGESMADVIFNGSNARKPVGQASIELIFDNSEGKLLGEYAAFTEISVKRKVTRDGQSAYFLNGTKCRRRDITDIFLGTGLGPRSYAIIEQGMISRLIESKPEELRIFIEEAAGISKYKERRRETETRIRHTRENLERLTDIRDELERQLGKLKRQATAAEKYKAYKEEEKQFKSQTLALQWQQLHEESSDQRQAIADLEIALEANIAAQRGFDAQLEELREEQIVQTDSFNTVQAKYYGVGAEISQLQQSIDHHNQRVEQLGSDLDETRSSAAQNNEHLRVDKGKLEEWKSELALIEPEHGNLSESEAASSEALAIAEANMQDWQSRWDDFNDRASEPQRNAEVQRSKIDGIEDSLRGILERIDRLKKEDEQLNLEPLTLESEQLETQHESLSAQVDEFEEKLSEANQTIANSRESTKQISANISSQRSQLQEEKGRLASLEALQAAAKQNVDEKANSFLNEKGLANRPRLMDNLQVSEGWEKAVETVLSGSLNAVTVDSLDQVFGDIASLGGADLCFVEQSATTDSANSLGLQTLSSCVSSAIKPTQLSDVFVADSFDQAVAQRSSLSGSQSIITRDGLWLGKNWVRVQNSDKDVNSGVIARQQQIDSLQEKLAQLVEMLDASELSLEDAERAVSDAESTKDQLLGEKSEIERQLNTVYADLRSVKTKIEQGENRKHQIANEVRSAESAQANQREALSVARASLDEAIESMQSIESEREILLDQRDHVRDVLTVTRETAQQDREAFQAVAIRVEGLKAQVSSTEVSVSRLEAQLEHLTQRQEMLVEQLEESKQPLPELKARLETDLENRVLVEEQLSEARNSLEAVDSAMRECERNRTEASQTTQNTRNSLEQLRINSQEMKVRSSTIEQQLQESGFKLEAVINTLPEEANLKAWQESLAEVQKRIERLGAINLAAIEEYETESERKRYLDQQNDELVSALETLDGAIQKIDKETRGLFKETFDKLNASLQDLFPKVFGGGSAYLELTGDDLLSTGVSIMARPPGKRNSTIHLLSGGEKALTAIALVFSIFKLNPAPFCMLDEVDAPLDDANTGRYANLIKEMSSSVQFIFITHNKITMEMADHLMGVTMHEPGCSRLVSVDIDEAVALATA